VVQRILHAARAKTNGIIAKHVHTRWFGFLTI